MPSGDRRGPNGNGPMTGRQLGYCAGYDEPGFVKDVPGRGMGRGYGGGMGRGYGAPVIVERQVVSSANQEDLIEDRIKQMKNEIQVLEKQLADQKKKEN